MWGGIIRWLCSVYLRLRDVIENGENDKVVVIARNSALSSQYSLTALRTLCSTFTTQTRITWGKFASCSWSLWHNIKSFCFSVFISSVIRGIRCIGLCRAVAVHDRHMALQDDGDGIDAGRRQEWFCGS
jgi:hypothetical protein